MASTTDRSSTSHVLGENHDRVAEVVLFAEFDIDKGSTLRESYPVAVPHYSPEFFADVMLPEGVHNRQADFTIFFLNRKNAHKHLLAPADASPVTVGDTSKNDADANRETIDPLQEFMYCISVVHTTFDASVRRGAKVKAVAICSRYKFCFAFKDVLSVAATKLAAVSSDADAHAILEQLFAIVNSVDTRSIRNLSDMERRLLKRTVSSSHSDDDAALYYRTAAQWGDLRIPLQVKRCSSDDQYDDGCLRTLLRKFGDQTMTLYNAVLTGARVLVLGYNQSAGDVCNYVLSMSALVCPPLFGVIDRQFPYANLTDLEFLEVPGFIAGVTNPMFKSKREWWDVLADLSTGDVLVASPPTERDDFEAADKNFVLEVLDGVSAGYDEEWIRCMFEEYTRKNVVDIALGEASVADVDAHVRRIATNNKRITKWTRTDSYKRLVAARQHPQFSSRAFNISFSSVVCTLSLQSDVEMLLDSQVERVYDDFAALLHAEDELLEFLSYLPALRGGLHTIAQGIFHPSMSVKHNTVVLLQRLESFGSTAASLQRLNAFVLMSYERMANIVQPSVRD